MRYRHKFIGIGSFIFLLLWTLSNPDAGIIQQLPVGASTIATLIILLKSILYIGMLHFGRKGLLDYIDLEKVIKKAIETPEGAGRVVTGIGIMMLSIALVIFAATIR